MISLQVLDDIDTKERETRAFAKLNNFIPGSKCIIITNSEETNLEYDGIDIEVIPIWKMASHGGSVTPDTFYCYKIY